MGGVVSMHVTHYDQEVDGEDIIKQIQPLGTVTPIHPPDDRSPVEIAGLVRTARTVIMPVSNDLERP